jgi:hypothetical protein
MIIEMSYIVYLLVSIIMTVWVAKTLSKNGLVFLIDSFAGKIELANSVNHMLVVGFYLINLGYILLALQTSQDLNSLRESIEFLSQKLGMVLLVIGLLHFTNVFVIAKWRNRAISHQSDVQESSRS